MFQVTTVNLAPDATAASTDYGEQPLGSMAAVGLLALLEHFRALDATQAAEAEPRLLISASAGRFIVRTNGGRLFLYNASDPDALFAELTAEGIIAQLARLATDPGAVDAAPAAAAPAPHRGIAVAILIAGLALNGYTLYSAFYTESVTPKTAVALLTDRTELAARQRDVVGTYATGAQPGDRTIVVGADGRVAFAEVGATRSIHNGDDTYRLGRHDNKLCLATTDSGLIDIVNIDTLVYYRDTYRRTK